ncbi:PilZ domain-containing protein [Roseibium hamelinense]|nr:PilZ domain-containing protein [Roseibium hamelinense]MTI42068.1 PilZ domain-containing protein [Roseibium hamelinense]
MAVNPAFKEQRLTPRRRARLRGGKITDLSDKFLTECTLFDVSEGGVGLLVPETADLPKDVLIYDDLDKTIAIANVRWRNGKQVGVAFLEPPIAVSQFNAPRLQALQHKYYAVDPEED